MNYKGLTCGVGLLLLSGLAHSVSIYKCTKDNKTVIFADKPCPDMDVMLIHTETEKEIKRRVLEQRTLTIKRLIASGQVDAAQEYALKNNLSEFYRKQLVVDAQQKTEAEKQRIERDRQQQISLQQQALAVQQQQLELQKRQLALEKAKLEQQSVNHSIYYPYYIPVQKIHCQSPSNTIHCTQVSIPTKTPSVKINLLRK
jgi:phage protein D